MIRLGRRLTGPADSYYCGSGGLKVIRTVDESSEVVCQMSGFKRCMVCLSSSKRALFSGQRNVLTVEALLNGSPIP